MWFSDLASHPMGQHQERNGEVNVEESAKGLTGGGKGYITRTIMV
jgi:hypothetical protein